MSLPNAPIYHVTETESTMDDARRLVSEGAPSGTVVVADYQRNGRGRRAGRVWYSPPGKSLMFTVATNRPDDYGTASLRAGLAVARSLAAVCGLSAAIKWPNDVIVADRKIAGVLCDLDGQWLYTGIGVNLAQRDLPDDLRAIATSVALEGGTLPATDHLLARILDELASPRPDWREELTALLWRRDHRVRVDVTAADPIIGVVEGVDEQGRLLVRESGRLHRLVAGEVSFRSLDG